MKNHGGVFRKTQPEGETDESSCCQGPPQLFSFSSKDFQEVVETVHISASGEGAMVECLKHSAIKVMQSESSCCRKLSSCFSFQATIFADGSVFKEIVETVYPAPLVKTMVECLEKLSQEGETDVKVAVARPPRLFAFSNKRCIHARGIKLCGDVRSSIK